MRQIELVQIGSVAGRRGGKTAAGRDHGLSLVKRIEAAAPTVPVTNDALNTVTFLDLLDSGSDVEQNVFGKAVGIIIDIAAGTTEHADSTLAQIATQLPASEIGAGVHEDDCSLGVGPLRAIENCRAGRAIFRLGIDVIQFQAFNRADSLGWSERLEPCRCTNAGRGGG